MNQPHAVRVLISSPLEPELVDWIAAVDSRLDVLYAPELLPASRYRSDHRGRPRDLSPAELAQWQRLLAQADVSWDFDWWAPTEMAVNCPNLAWVQATSSGIGEMVRTYGLDRSGIQLTTAAGVHAIPLAEFAVMGALYFIKDLPRLAAAKAGRQWQRYTSRQLAGQRVVVIGLGHLGRQVAATFSVLGAEVWGVGRDGATYDVNGATQIVGLSALDDVLPDADVLVLCCPLTTQTAGLMDARRLGLLPAHAVVVNIARGDVVVEPDLIEVLQSGGIAGACLDVFSVEPLPAESPLWDMDNVVVSPHSASTVDGENEQITQIFCDNLERWLSNRPLRNVFDVERGY